MKVQLRYFASVRETLGHTAETLETQATDVQTLLQELRLRSHAHAQALSLKGLRMACNQSLCDGATPLSDGCEIAFFPPVTGG